MSRCTVCKHPELSSINRSILSGISLRTVGANHGITATTMHRHASRCLPGIAIPPAPEELAEALEEPAAEFEDVVEVTEMTLAEEMADIKNKTRAIYDAAMSAERPRANMALAALNALAKQIDMFGNMMLKHKELQDREHDVNNDQDWIALRGRIIVALDPFPEAKRAVLAAMGVDLELVPVEHSAT